MSQKKKGLLDTLEIMCFLSLHSFPWKKTSVDFLPKFANSWWSCRNRKVVFFHKQTNKHEMKSHHPVSPIRTLCKDKLWLVGDDIIRQSFFNVTIFSLGERHQNLIRWPYRESNKQADDGGSGFHILNFSISSCVSTPGFSRVIWDWVEFNGPV